MYTVSKFRAGPVMMVALLAGAMTSCVTDEEASETAVVQDVDINNLISCAIDGGVRNSDICISDERFITTPRTTMFVDESRISIPSGVRGYEWSVVSADGSVRVISGCQFGLACVFDVEPACRPKVNNVPTMKKVDVSLIVYDTRNPARFERDVNTIYVINTDNPLSPRCLRGLFSSCVTRPATAPYTTIRSNYCGGQHSMYATLIPGATYTQFQTKGSRSLSWSKLSDTYGFPGITVENEDAYCDGDANGDFYARARACNECGCTAWGPEANFSYFPYECR